LVKFFAADQTRAKIGEGYEERLHRLGLSRDRYRDMMPLPFRKNQPRIV
jgi:hypothetical protein